MEIETMEQYFLIEAAKLQFPNAALINQVLIDTETNEEIPVSQEILAAKESLKRQSLLNEIKLERTQRLAGSDWTQLPDAPVDKDAWAEFRQQLRDFPGPDVDLENPVWPVAPGAN